MRIVAVSMVRNESDIIESFVRYHAPLFDGHYFLDNKSSDSTLEILRRLLAEGLSISLSEDANGFYDQRWKMTELMQRAAAETDADFILPLDVDEFVLASDRTELERRLCALGDRVGMFKWFDYIALPSDDRNEIDPLRRICHRIEPASPRYKVCVPRHVALRSTAWLFWGQHDINDDAEGIERLQVETPLLAHIPIRSGSQLASKAIIGRLAIRASRDWMPGLGFHWDHIAQLIKQPSAVTDEEVYQATLVLSNPPRTAKIVRSPLIPPYPALRYPELISVDVLSRLLEFTSQLLDDEMQFDAGNADNEIDRRISLADGLLPHNWRRGWMAKHDECEALKKKIAVLERTIEKHRRRRPLLRLARSARRAVFGRPPKPS